MKKRNTMIALMCATMVALLAGCGGNASSGADAASGAASSASSSSASEALSETLDQGDEMVASVFSEAPDEVAESTPAASSASSATPTATPDDAALSASAPAPEEVAQTDEDLGVILTEIKENIQEGTAGASLKTATVAADVLDFMMHTELTADEISAQTAAYFEALSEDEKMEYPNQVLLMGEMIYTLQQDADGAASDILENAGVTDSGYPWSDDAFAKAAAIQQGCGL